MCGCLSNSFPVFLNSLTFFCVSSVKSCRMKRFLVLFLVFMGVFTPLSAQLLSQVDVSLPSDSLIKVTLIAPKGFRVGLVNESSLDTLFVAEKISFVTTRGSSSWSVVLLDGEFVVRSEPISCFDSDVTIRFDPPSKKYYLHSYGLYVAKVYSWSPLGMKKTHFTRYAFLYFPKDDIRLSSSSSLLRLSAVAGFFATGPGLRSFDEALEGIYRFLSDPLMDVHAFNAFDDVPALLKDFAASDFSFATLDVSDSGSVESFEFSFNGLINNPRVPSLYPSEQITFEWLSSEDQKGVVGPAEKWMLLPLTAYDFLSSLKNRRWKIASSLLDGDFQFFFYPLP